MKKSGKFLLVLMFVLLVFSSILFSAEKAIKVVHVALGNYGDHWVQLVSGARDMAKLLGIDLTVLDAQMSNSKQVQMLDNAITMRPDAIFIDHGEGTALKPGIQRAMNLGIPVIIFDVSVDTEVTSEIAQDDYMLAYLSLSALAQDLKGEGNVVVVTLSGVAPLERRMRILPLILERYPKIKVIDQIAPTFGSAVISSTMSLMDAVLRAHSNEIDAIWAPYDQLAIGSLNALKQANKKIPIYGVDVSSYDLSLMAEPNSNWMATAACDPSEIGKVAMRIAYLSATNQNDLVPRYAFIPPVLITQEIASKIDLKKGEFLSKDLIPAWGDTDIAWTEEMRELVEKNQKK